MRQEKERFDVIVVGGGPAGCAAAIASAREGAKTLLVEAAGALGGMGTLGLVPAWCPFSDKEKIIYRGLAEKIFTACKEGMPHIDNEAMDWVAIDPELLKRIYEDMVLEAGAKILFNTTLAAVEKEGDNVVSSVILANKAGLTAYRAKTYVDCTGDADLAAWAGAEFQKGDEETGELQPGTLCFIISNVNEEALKDGPRLHKSHPESPIHKILASGKYPRIADKHLCNSLIGPGTVGFNANHVYDVDNTDPESVTKALIEGRKLARDIRDALAEFYPEAFGNSFLASTAPLMGIRETRRVIGDYVLTVGDYKDRKSFPDEICRNSYYIDIHFSAKELALEKEGKIDHAERCLNYEAGESHGIPYRCLTPKDLTNVLVAGRSVSCDRRVQGSVRVMPVCLAMGEAAGLAAALSAGAKDRDVHRVDVETLRTRLKEEGAYLPDSSL